MADTPYVKGATKLRQRIATIRAGVPFALNRAVSDAGQLILQRTRNRYLRGVDPDGRPWTALSGATLVRKKRPPTSPQYRDKGQLAKGFSTGALYGSIQLIRGSSAGLFAAVTGAGVRIGIGNAGAFGPVQKRGKDIAQYARTFQQGSANQPARRFIGIGALDVKSVDSLLRNRIRRLVDGQNF